jgi:glucose-6-phosphate 1-dehydrogenase
MIGLRILIEKPYSSDYYVKYEFKDANWKQQAIYYLPKYIGKKRIKIQTLHSFSTSYNLKTGNIIEPRNIWLDNIYIKVNDLY